MTLREQWNKIKSRHPDKVVGFKIGETLEFFDIDAVYAGNFFGEYVRQFVDNDNTTITAISIPYRKAVENIPDLKIYEETKNNANEN